jgi:hypothetical protein
MNMGGAGERITESMGNRKGAADKTAPGNPGYFRAGGKPPLASGSFMDLVKKTLPDGPSPCTAQSSGLSKKDGLWPWTSPGGNCYELSHTPTTCHLFCTSARVFELEKKEVEPVPASCGLRFEGL